MAAGPPPTQRRASFKSCPLQLGMVKKDTPVQTSHDSRPTATPPESGSRLPVHIMGTSREQVPVLSRRVGSCCGHLPRSTVSREVRLQRLTTQSLFMRHSLHESILVANGKKSVQGFRRHEDFTELAATNHSQRTSCLDDDILNQSETPGEAWG